MSGTPTTHDGFPRNECPAPRRAAAPRGLAAGSRHRLPVGVIRNLPLHAGAEGSKLRSLGLLGQAKTVVCVVTYCSTV